ncbi:MAG: hypothetical protein DRP63_04975 [Planctomycetota bacterium]|nr:MAG: hypothetical protein DRP63_04975 [Planctomycetota bacterium]
MKVPRFSSLREFLEWWNSREGRRLRKNPAAVEHPNIKPWLQKLLAGQSVEGSCSQHAAQSGSETIRRDQSPQHIRVVCPTCGAAYDFPQRYSGKRARCRCGTIFSIPTPAASYHDPSRDEAAERVDVPRPKDRTPTEQPQVDAAETPRSIPAETTPPTSPVAEQEQAAESEGKVFADRYRVMRRIGAGAMGVVYYAYDEVLRIPIALKVLRHEDLAGKKEVERFLREAQEAAKLNHPNIVRVYNAGFDQQGRPFIAMQYVEGWSLAQLLAARKKGRRSDAPRMSDRELLRIFAQAAEALAYAHRQHPPVVHRDIKPANVMVDRDGHAYLMDFGLAKQVRGRSRSKSLTVSGAVLGTPAYMSPEQAEGKIRQVRPASDVFSFGVMLYEAFCGRLPFEGGNVWEVLAAVIRSEPPLPRQLRRNIPRDLDAIIMKCLEKDPWRRYRNGGELAADLRRLLRGKPVSARPLSRFSLLMRRLKRRKGLVASMATLAAMAIVLGVALRGPGAGRSADTARRKAEAILKRLPLAATVEEQLKIYERAIRVAPQWQNLYLRKGELLKNNNRYDEAVKVFEKAAKIARRQGDRTGEAVAYFHIGTIYWAQGQSRLAAGKTLGLEKGKVDKALRCFRKVLKLLPNVRNPMTLYAQAVDATEKGHYDRAIRLLTEAIGMNPRFAGAFVGRGIAKVARDDLDGAIADFSKAIELNPHNALAFYNRGLTRACKDNLDGAIADLSKVIELNPRLADAYNDRAIVKAIKGDLDGAMADHTKAIELDPQNGRFYYNRGITKMNKSDLDGAIADYTKAIELDPRCAEAYNNRGTVWLRKNEYDKALADFTKAIELNPRLAAAYNNRAIVWTEKGQYLRAWLDWKKATELDPELAKEPVSLPAWTEKGELGRAMADWTKLTTLSTDPNRESAEALHIRGIGKHQRGDYDGAIADLTKAIELKPDYVEAFVSRGIAWAKKGEYDRAIADYTKAIKLNPRFAEAYNCRGIAWRRKGNYDKAIADYTKAIELYEEAGKMENVVLAHFHRGIAKSKKGDYDGAVADLKKVVKLKPWDRLGWLTLAALHSEKRRKKECLEALRRLLRLNAAFKSVVRNADAFKWLRDDPEFKRLTE